MWLFEWVLYMKNVDKVLILYKQVLAMTYWGLCQGCTQTAHDIVLTWKPTSIAAVVVQAVRNCVVDHRPQPIWAGFVPQRSGGHADTLDQSTSKYDCRWSIILQLNFKLLIILTYVCIWPRQMNKSKKCIAGALRSSIDCGHMTWSGTHTTLWWLHNMPPDDLSSLCTCDQRYWFTHSMLVFNIESCLEGGGGGGGGC
jgi:hypothetical protein